MPAGGIDVLIRGAGPVGCVAALALRSSSHKIALVDHGHAAPAFRPIVLSYASRLILERVGVWNGLAVTPIDSIHVSQAGAFGRTVLKARWASEMDVSALAPGSYVLTVLDAAGAPIGVRVFLKQ